MAQKLPDKITENSLDDVQSIDFDIDVLYNKFIVPIEMLRSMSAPVIFQSPKGQDVSGSITQKELDNANVDNSSAQESRAHAFYRSIGLPVIDQDGNFYNPGFNPKRSEKIRIQNNSIADRAYESIKKMAQLRESSARSRYDTFRRQGINASVYTLALSVLDSKNIKKFQVMNKSADFTIVDEQKFTIGKRKSYIKANYSASDGSELGTFFESGSHMIRPLVCDSAIEKTVMPASRLVCEPFLASDYDTVLELDIFLQRPKIEQILRLRLSDNVDEAAILDESIFLMDPSANISGLALTDLRRVALALLDDNNISDQDLLDKINASNVELVFINNIVRTMKMAIDILINSIETVSVVAKNIDWTPISLSAGPLFGTDIGSLIAKKTMSTELERRIINLSLKSQNSSRQFTPANLKLGNYALGSFDNMEKLFENELMDAKEQKNEFIRLGSNALRAIEIITGEISGLGLIDVLAVYAALWSIDLDVLISLLDNNAFNRLYDNNKSLRNSNVVSRHNGSPKYSVKDAIIKLENRVINILAFADRLLEQKLASPKLSEGGSI